MLFQECFEPENIVKISKSKENLYFSPEAGLSFLVSDLILIDTLEDDKGGLYAKLSSGNPLLKQSINKYNKILRLKA